MSDFNSSLVYSTEKGRLCPGCGNLAGSCICREKENYFVPEGPGGARLSYETKGCKGKGMTVISGLALNRTELDGLAKKLKQCFGTGGAVKDRCIMLQGDFREPAAVQLRRLGYPVK
jgi:translation initiation factor 1